MEISTSTVGASSFLMSYMCPGHGRSDVIGTVDSPPKFRAPWREAAFAIGGCGLYSALPVMAKRLNNLEY